MMAFLMFFSSVGITMDMHYCGGKLMSVSFIENAKTCHDITRENHATMKNCPNHKKIKAEKEGCSEDKNCCSNKTIKFQSSQDQKIQTNDFVVTKQLKQFVVAYVAVFFADGYELDVEAANIDKYKPPLLERDIPVLNQSFLI